MATRKWDAEAGKWVWVGQLPKVTSKPINRDDPYRKRATRPRSTATVADNHTHLGHPDGSPLYDEHGNLTYYDGPPGFLGSLTEKIDGTGTENPGDSAYEGA